MTYTYDGSPAHAGIDPRVAPEQDADGRFPRTRGDRPTLWPAYSPRSVVPPHTRG